MKVANYSHFSINARYTLVQSSHVTCKRMFTFTFRSCAGSRPQRGFPTPRVHQSYPQRSTT